MRFAAIADIHGNSAALDAVLEDIAREDLSGIVNLGDSLSGPLDPAGTADRLMRRPWPTVAGNHDRGLIDRPPEDQGLWEQWTYPQLTPEHLDWLRGLPPVIERDGLFLCHGTPESDMTFWLHVLGSDDHMRGADHAEVEAQARGIEAGLILCAHTHLAGMARLADGRLVVNPGSVGCPAYADPRPPRPHVSATGSPAARYAILDGRPEGWHVAFRAVPYDASAMIEQARALGQEDWAEALATGWITRP